MFPTRAQVECPTCKREAADFGGEASKMMVEIPVGTEVGAIGKRTCAAGHTFQFRTDPKGLEVFEEGSDEGDNDIQM